MVLSTNILATISLPEPYLLEWLDASQPCAAFLRMALSP